MIGGDCTELGAAISALLCDLPRVVPRKRCTREI